MLFYRYQKLGDVQFGSLRRGEIFFAAPSELNDPHECRPRFILKGSGDLWERLAQFILDEVCFDDRIYSESRRRDIESILVLGDIVGQKLRKRANNRDFEIELLAESFDAALVSALKEKCPAFDARAIRTSARRFIAVELPIRISETRYIASFSQNALNPTMWGHYADAEKGFVIVYETHDETIEVRSPFRILNGIRRQNDYVAEIGRYTQERVKLKEVRYRRQTTKVNAFYALIPKFHYSEAERHYDVPEQLGGDAEEKEENLLGLVKYSDWRYERELRAFFPTYSILPPDARVLRVAANNIRGLIFGPRMTATDKARAVVCCKAMRDEAAKCAGPKGESTEYFGFFQADYTADRFDLAVKAVGTLKENYDGEHLPFKGLNDLQESVVEKLNQVVTEITGHADRRKTECGES